MQPGNANGGARTRHSLFRSEFPHVASTASVISAALFPAALCSSTLCAGTLAVISTTDATHATHATPCTALLSAVAPTSENLQRFMRTVLGMVHDHQDSWPFQEPVDPAEVPDYYEVIKTPMSLALIQQRLGSQQYYVNLEMFAADFRIMFNNARKYNAQDTEYYKCANRLVRFPPLDGQWRTAAVVVVLFLLMLTVVEVTQMCLLHSSGFRKWASQRWGFIGCKGPRPFAPNRRTLSERLSRPFPFSASAGEFLRWQSGRGACMGPETLKGIEALSSQRAEVESSGGRK